jgi:hypothetical protein
MRVEASMEKMCAISSRPVSRERAPSRTVTVAIGSLLSATAAMAAVSVSPAQIKESTMITRGAG